VRHRAARAGTVLLSAGLLAAAIAAPALATSHHKAKPKERKGTEISTTKTSLGKVVANEKRRVMYLFTKDGRKVSHCTGACLSVWPRVTSKAKPRGEHGVLAKHLGLTKKHQVTYYGHPLYYFVSDHKAGRAKGEGINHFFVVSTHGKAIKPKKKAPVMPAPTSAAVVSSGMAATTAVITDAANGHTLYELSDETDGANPSFSCTGVCNQVWIPLLTQGAPTASGGAMASELGTVVRPDNTTQVTYNHHPVYTYVPDTAAGDANGEGVYDPPGYWYDMSPAGAPIL
jgi:predicted lipoprotein with Yx(FWY)xxD motif